MNEIYQQVLYYSNTLWQRRWYAMPVTWFVCAIGWTIIVLLPNSYTSEARIYVDTANVLEPLLRGLAVENDVEAELTFMQQTLLSRPNLQNVARMTDLDIKATTPAALERLIEDLQKNTSLTSDGTNLFKVNFSDSDPVQARDVVQALLTIFVESNLGQSRKDLDSARRFIDEQIREYELELAAAEQRLAKFKQNNAGVLPGEVSYARKIDEVVAELARVDEALRGTILRRDTLRNELDQTSQFIELEASAAGGGFGPPSDVAVQIIELQQGLDELLSRYTAMHPDVQIAQRRLDALTQTRDEELQAQVENGDAFGNSNDDAPAGLRAPNTIYEQLKLDLVEEEANVAILSDRLDRAQTTVATMRGLASRVPEVEAELANLNRDYEIIQAQQEEFLARRESAKVSRDREIKADQEQFRVVEPPIVPVAPSGPPRLIFLTVTLIAGIGAGIGFAWVLVMSNDTIPNLGRLREMFALPVLGAVSTVDTITKRGWTMLHSSTFIGVFVLLIVFYAGLILAERQIGLANLVSEELISAYYNRAVAIAAEPALNVLNTLSERLIAILTEMLGR